MHTLPPIDQVRRDLTAHLYGLAHMLDRCVRPGAGASILSLEGQVGELEFPKYDDFDLSAIPLAQGLGAVYRYTASGEFRPSGREDLSLDPNEGALGRMKLLVSLTSNPETSYCLDEVSDAFDDLATPRGGFRDMVALAVARATLDEGEQLTLDQVALLAGVSERTVSNAMAMKGDSRLAASRDAEGPTVVAASEAARWLSGRRAFLKSVAVRREAPSDELSAQELTTFITTRMHEEVPDEGFDYEAMKNREVRSIPGQRLVTLCRVLGWSEECAQAWTDGNLDALNLDDCEAAAGVLKVDTGWLTRQLMNVRFPDAGNRLEATLTEAGIRSGYFDLEQRFARRFFPEDSFGGRGSDELGAPVRLHVDGKSYETDIRVKSQALVSPRKRFTAYFSSHQAKPGDKVRITRTGERDFELAFTATLPSEASNQGGAAK